MPQKKTFFSDPKVQMGNGTKKLPSLLVSKDPRPMSGDVICDTKIAWNQGDPQTLEVTKIPFPKRVTFLTIPKKVIKELPGPRWLFFLGEPTKTTRR